MVVANWDQDLKPHASGMTSCPMTHREYVVSGRIRYLVTDGSEVQAKVGDLLFLPPGHRGWVLGEEAGVLIDWSVAAACHPAPATGP